MNSYLQLEEQLRMSIKFQMDLPQRECRLCC